MIPAHSRHAFEASAFAWRDILCSRHFLASSNGPAYTSVWHRDPEGQWRFHQNVPPLRVSPRYFGSALGEVLQIDIDPVWAGSRSFRIAIPGRIEWEVSLARSVGTRAINALGSHLSDRVWRSPGVLRAMRWVAGQVLGAGKSALPERSPNGQRFLVNPGLIWTIPSSRATVDDRNLGSVRFPRPQVRLVNFWIRRKGLFAIGRAIFDAFDPAHHSAVASGRR